MPNDCTAFSQYAKLQIGERRIRIFFHWSRVARDRILSRVTGAAYTQGKTNSWSLCFLKISRTPSPLRHPSPFSSQLRVHTTNERKASMLARPIWTWFNRSSLDPQRDSCAREKVEIVVEEKCKIMHRRWRTWWVNCFIGIDYFGNKMGFVLSDILFGLGVV